MSIINVQDICFSYDDKNIVIDHVSFAIKEGSYTTIIGHNGSGKSTIAKLLIGLKEAQSGTIEIDGLPMTLEHINEIRSRVGVVFQNPDNQFIGSSVADDIAFGLENHQMPSEEMQERIESMAAKVGMLEFLQSEPTNLSGGQKQRVAIAGVLAMDLKVIILDEATSMLDPKGKKEINDLIDELHTKTNLTIISITHDIEEVTKSDHVIVMDAGEVLLQGKPKTVLGKEKELKNSNLDIPFALKLIHKLKKKGMKLKKDITIEGVVSQICQSHLKK